MISPKHLQIDRLRALLASAAAAVSLLLGACSCDDTDPWRATYISTSEAGYGPPACDTESSDAVRASAEASGTHVDPNLVEIARLEVERDCYKGAEAALRQHLALAPPPLKLGAVETPVVTMQP